MRFLSKGAVSSLSFVLTLASGTILTAQTLSLGGPSKEYVRLGGRIVAVENGCSWAGPINASSPANNVSVANGMFTLSALSGDIWSTADSFEFVACAVQGDVTIVARVANFQRGAYDPGAGVMLRESLAPGSPNVLAGLEDEFVYESWRSSSGAATGVFHGPSVHDGYWVKLVRVGNTVTGYYSTNGGDWAQIGTPQTLAAPVIYAGLALSGYDNVGVSTASFDNVSISTAPDFYFTPQPISWTSSSAGDTTSYALGVAAVNGFNGTVNFTVAGLPTGVSYIVNPPSITASGVSVLTITVPPNVPAGGYPFVITAAGGSAVHSQIATLNVGAGGIILPLNWTSSAIGSTNTQNSAAYANGVFTLSAQSGDIWSGSDSFEFAYQPLLGDGSIIARIATRSMSPAKAVAGIMLREGIMPTSLSVVVGLYNGNVYRVWRPTAGATSTATTGPVATAPYWVKLVRSGTSVTTSYSTNGVDWTQLGNPVTVSSSLLYAGLALSGYDNVTLASATFDNVTVTSDNGATAPDFTLGVPADTQTFFAGSSLTVPTTITAAGGFNGKVSFSLANLPSGVTPSFSPPLVTGSGASAIILNAAQGATPGIYTPVLTATSGSLSHSANISLTVISLEQLPQVQSVVPASGSGTGGLLTVNASAGSGAPNWLEVLINSGLNGLNACYIHYDQTSNTLYLRDDVNPSWAGSGVIGAPESLSNSQCSVELGASSFSASGTNLQLTLSLSYKRPLVGDQQIFAIVDDGTFSSSWQSMATWNVTLPSGALPIGWNSAPIGATDPANTTSYTDGVYTLSALSGDVWGTSDSFEFAYQRLTGDGTAVARISTFQNGTASAFAAVMLREGATSTSLNVAIGIENGKIFGTSRSSSGASTLGSYGPVTMAPYWVKLVRAANSITSYYSADGVNWAQLGSAITVNSSLLYAGLALSGFDNVHVSTASFDNVLITNTPDFYLVPQPALQTVFTGLPVPFSVNIQTLNGFSGTVNGFSVSGLPAGASPSFVPSSITGSGVSTLTVQTASNSTPGTYNLLISATSGVLSRTSPATLNISSGVSPRRQVGSVLDTGNALSTNLVGLFVMNEGAGTTDVNLVNGNGASISGSSPPTWNIADPSIAFSGGSSLHSYLSAGTDLAFDQLPTSKVTVAAKVYLNSVSAAGVFEKDDGNATDSGIVLGWDSSGSLHLTVEKSSADMRVSTEASAVTAGQWVQVAITWDGSVGTAAAAHLFVNGVEQTKTSSNNGSGTLGYSHATNQPFRIGNASFDPMAGSLNGRMAYLAVYKGRILNAMELTQLDAQLPIQ